MARTCPACGRANDDDASFCQSCGASIAGAPEESLHAPFAPPAPPAQTPVAPPDTTVPAPPPAFGAPETMTTQPGPPPPPGAGPPAGAPPRPGGRTPGWVIILIVALVLAVAAVAALLVLPREVTPGNGENSPAPSSGATVAASPSPALGQYLAGAVGPRADRLAAITEDGTVKPITRFSGQQIWQIAYSPDGKWLACVAGTFKRSEVWLFDATSGDARQATAATPSVVAVDSIAWLSPTEVLVAGHTETPKATGQNADFLVYDTATQEFAPLLDGGGVPLRGVAVSASRDGARVAFVTYTDVKTDQYGMVRAKERLEVLDRASGAVVELGANEAFFDVNARAFDEPLISPSGEALIYRRAGSDVGTSYTVVAADGATLMEARETQFPAGYAWDPAGSKVVFTGHPLKPAANESGIGPAIFWIFDTESGTTEEVARYKDTMVQDVSWSPDGQTIAWAEYDQDKYQTGNVYLLPAAGGDSKSLVQEALSPVWAPSGDPSLQTSTSP
jgi:Tol biopolymer transport system component